MKVLLDINVVLDVLLNRTPWVSEAAAVWDAHRAGRVAAHVAAFTIPTAFHIVRRQGGLQRAEAGVQLCLSRSRSSRPTARRWNPHSNSRVPITKITCRSRPPSRPTWMPSSRAIQPDSLTAPSRSSRPPTLAAACRDRWLLSDARETKAMTSPEAGQSLRQNYRPHSQEMNRSPGRIDEKRESGWWPKQS